MKDLENTPFELSGSTATIALIVNNKVCYIINLGDSRAVIGRKSNTKNEAIQLNKVHNASEGKYLLLTQYLESNHSHFHKILFTKKSLLIIKEKVMELRLPKQ